MSEVKHGFSRRDFLKGGGALVVGLAMVPAALRATSTTALAATSSTEFPPPTDPTQLNTWIAVQADGAVIARCGHVELGQGNQTSLAQIVAEELDVPFAKVRMVLGDTDVTYDQGGTYGSTTIHQAGLELRQISAEVHAALLQMASKNLSVPASKLSVKNGVVSGGGKSIAYGKLVQGQVLTAVAPISVKAMQGSISGISGSVKPKDPSKYTIVGKPTMRVDIPGKVTGEFTYNVDVKVPNMLHARVVHPTGLGSEVVSIGSFSKPIPNAQVVKIGNLVAVVAEQEWDAIKGAQTLEIEWSPWNGLPPSSNIWPVLQATDGVETVVLNRGDAKGTLASAKDVVTATYLTPYEDHGTMGPNCAIADYHSDGTIEIWSTTQYPQGLRTSIASMLGIPPANVTVYRYEGPGMYGRMGMVDDAASEAVLISQKVGRPVRVQWMRADEHIWEPHSPATVHVMKGAVDDSGKVVAWYHEAWIPPWLEGIQLGGALAGLPTITPKLTFVGTWDNPDLYQWPNAFELNHGLKELDLGQTPYVMGMRTSFMRSPAQYQLTFAQESFVDELAAKAKVDALQFRLNHLKDPRAIAVLKAVARKSDWKKRPSPQKGASTQNGSVTGRGIALVLRDGTYAAGTVTATVNPATGAIHVDEVTVAQDAGQAINPIGIRHQMESCVLQTLSRALHEEMTFDTSNVTSRDWDTYPILTMEEVPDELNIIIIDHPEIAPTGSGEPVVNVITNALCSAIFDATGVRIRQLPLRPENVTNAMGTTVYDNS